MQVYLVEERKTSSIDDPEETSPPLPNSEGALDKAAASRGRAHVLR